MIFGLETDYRLGIAVSVLSALLSAWFNVINGVLVYDSALRIGFYEMVTRAGDRRNPGSPGNTAYTTTVVGNAYERYHLSTAPRPGLHQLRLRRRDRGNAPLTPSP